MAVSATLSRKTNLKMTSPDFEPAPVKDRIEVEFDKFHAKHPEVYRQLIKLAYEWKSHGHSKLGIATIFERLRWEWHVGNIKDDEGYKLNNNYRALYARKMMNEFPDLDGLFEIRKRTSEKWL